MKRILWMSNVSLSKKNINSSGTWIYSMFDKISKNDSVKVIANITLGDCASISCVETEKIVEYFIPKNSIKKNGLPVKCICEQLIQLILDIKPDLIHVWGIELFWGIIAQDLRLREFPYLIEIQGIKGEYQRPCWFYGGLSPKEIRSTFRLLEVINPNNYYPNLRKRFEEWGKVEDFILKKANFINTQSEYVRSIIYSKTRHAKIYNTGIILRDEFLISPIWSDKHKFGNAKKTILAISAPRIYKGIHDTIKAVAIIKPYYKNLELRIAGIAVNSNYYKNSGYIQFVLKLIKALGLEHNVTFMGNLCSERLLNEMYEADVCVNSTYIETYCLALAEPLCVGVPCVASYTSALPELMEESISGFFYTVGDYHTCAHKILKVLNMSEQALRQLSVNASVRMRHKSDAQSIALNQIKIYEDIITNSSDLCDN